MSLSLSEIYTPLRNAIGDEGDPGVTQDYTDSALNSYIAQAVLRYSGYVPHVIKTTLSSVAYQSEYLLPSAATGVQQVKWYSSAVAIPADLAGLLSPEWRDDALISARDQLIANLDRLTKTSWAVINYPNSFMGGLYLRLYPAPINNGDDIEVWYTTAHPLVGSSYPTIRNEHSEHIVNLAAAIVLRREARILLRQPDVGTGTGIRIGSAPGKELIREAEYLEQSVQDALSPPVGGRG